MPILGFGTYRISECEPFEHALALGYRLIDTGSYYLNEELIGQALKASGIAREEVFLTTKVWTTEMGYEGTLEACAKSLARFDTPYIDLYLAHWPVNDTMRDTWRAMEELYRAGKVRAIGVSNYEECDLALLAQHATVMPMVNQTELHPRLQQPELCAYCKELGIQMEAHTPIMRSQVRFIRELGEIGAKYNKTECQVALRWEIQRGWVSIPKAQNLYHIEENAQLFDFTLTEEEMAVIDDLDRDDRMGPNPDTFRLDAHALEKGNLPEMVQMFLKERGDFDKGSHM
ncbi:aldo/keto reductase [Kipferlia bialata]|uniref:Aldo/keto reductase n=1 Tax=Kipferlia bialata TaxID=797122 RepID=A0A9K3CQC0_9EUKA|nr:aldo/keto reductase [Kipferlia bialata]|eukprot:g1188.t1